jgi:ferrous iron transport protein B
VGGFAIFIGIMLTLFQALFTGADPLIGLVEGAVGWLGDIATAALPAGLLTELLVEGVIGGVGNVVVFLPQILLLFFFIGLLEDSGYMARAAYLMDRVMRSLGLHGRAFVPMLSGFACAVPAVLATRTMERKRDRLLTMMVVPLMTCSARLPVYTLVIAALFAPSIDDGVLPVQGLVMMAMYLFSVVIALAAAWVMGRTVLKGPHVPLILELPPYRLPSLGSVARMMQRRSGAFIKEAGTVILAATVVMWALLRFPAAPPPDFDLDTASPQRVSAYEADALAHSAAGRMGKALEPAIRPLGFDWRTGVGIIGAFAAREVFVSTMGLVYGIGEEVDEHSVPLREKLSEATHADGTPVWTPLSGLSLMVFFALACQCMSTLAVVKRETGGYRWPAFLFAYMTALAWVASFVVFQGGRLLGFS